MTSDEFKIITFLVISGSLLTHKSFKNLKRRRLILDIPTSKIKSAAIGGLVEVIGKVAKINSDKMTAPIQNIDATAFVWILYEKIQRNKRSEWREINRHYSDEFILIKDHSGGIATVKLRDCDLYYPKYRKCKNFNLRSNSFSLKVKEILINKFNINIGERVSFFSFTKTYRLEEIVIPRNKVVYCLGHSFAPEECPIEVKTRTKPSLYFKAHSENKRFFDNEKILLSFLSQEKTISKLGLFSKLGLMLGIVVISIGLFMTVNMFI